VDKFDPVTRACDVEHSKEAVGELVVAGGDSSIDLEVADHALDAVALAVEAFAVADHYLAVRFGRDDRLDATLLEVIADCIGIVGFVGKQCARRLLRQVDQRVVCLAVRRFARREVESNGPTSGITETMNFTGEPAPRAAKSSLMNPPFPPAAETCARTVVLSML
jgi:hypothetical protein